MESVTISLAFLGSGYFWSGLALGVLVVGPLLRMLLRGILPGND